MNQAHVFLWFWLLAVQCEACSRLGAPRLDTTNVCERVSGPRAAGFRFKVTIDNCSFLFNSMTGIPVNTKSFDDSEGVQT